MITLPTEIMTVLIPFTQAFSERTWDWAQTLLIGTILAPGKRTVTAALRVLGLKDDKQYQNYHRVLNRAKWSGLQVSQILLGLLVTAFMGTSKAVVAGADETLERRRGTKIKAKGTFRDAVRSSHKYTNYSSGLRWVSMMLLVPLPWSDRIWALPFLTVLAPSPKTNAANGKRHKTSIDWVGQMIGVVRRWLPQRELILVVDGGMAALKLGLRCAGCNRPVTLVSRLRLDAALYEPPKPQPKSKRGPKPKKGDRLPSLAQVLSDSATIWTKQSIDWYGGKQRLIEYTTSTALWYTPSHDPLPIRWVLVRDPLGGFNPTAFFTTDQEADPIQILDWFIMRWGLEVTFEEARAHLGMETQRQWSDLAIQRTTPALLGLFSLITLLAHQLSDAQPPVQNTAWYVKRQPTFSDAIAFVRFYLWTTMKYVNSPPESRFRLIPDSVLSGLVETICYAT